MHIEHTVCERIYSSVLDLWLLFLPLSSQLFANGFILVYFDLYQVANFTNLYLGYLAKTTGNLL